MTRIHLALALTLAACTETASPPAGGDARGAPDYREEECVALCTPATGAICPESSEADCRYDCELARGRVQPAYCAPEGATWRAWECADLCAHGGTCAGATAGACATACEAWSETGAYCPGGVQP